jgi:soluble lytic murein transglycosylase-like protein
MSMSRLKYHLAGRLGPALTVLHHGLALIGFLALVVVLVRTPYSQPIEESAGRSTTMGTIRYGGQLASLGPLDGANGEKFRALVSYLSRRYRIAPDITEQFVGAAYDSGQQVGLDPLLILAVVAIESRFNPIAESLVGARGLMQVVPKHHQDKLSEHGGEDALLNPMVNIALGARILKEYIRRTGSLEAGLQYYNGALADPSSQYAQRVIAEKDRLQQAVRQVNHAAARSAI